MASKSEYICEGDRYNQNVMLEVLAIIVIFIIPATFMYMFIRWFGEGLTGPKDPFVGVLAVVIVSIMLWLMLGDRIILALKS